MIIVTRPSPYGEELVQLCHQANLPAKHLPFFNIIKGKDFDQLQLQLNMLAKNDIVIVVSPQIVYMLQQQKANIEFPDFVHYFAIGSQTAKQLQILSNQKVDYPPIEENSEGLIDYFTAIKLPIAKHRILLLSGDISRSVIQENLKNQGASVKNIVFYQRNIINYPPTILADDISSDFIVTSVEHLLQLEGYSTEQHKQNAKLIVSSQRIVEMAKKQKWQHIYLAKNANNQNLFKTIVSLCHNAITV